MNDPQEYEPTTISGEVTVQITFSISNREETSEEIEDIIITSLESILKAEDVDVELIESNLSEDFSEPPGYNKEDDEYPF